MTARRGERTIRQRRTISLGTGLSCFADHSICSSETICLVRESPLQTVLDRAIGHATGTMNRWVPVNGRSSPPPPAGSAHRCPAGAEFGLAEVLQASFPCVMPCPQPEGHPGKADQPRRHRKVDIVEIGGIVDIVRSPMYQVAQQERDEEDRDLHPLGREGAY